MNLSEYLRVYREESGLSQEEVAEQLDTTRQTLSNWENGKTDPDASSLAALARLYGKTVDALLHGAPEEEAEKQPETQPETQPEEPPADTPEIVPEEPPAVQEKPKKKELLLIALAALLALALSFAAGWWAHAHVQSHTENEMQLNLSEPHGTFELSPLENN